MLFCIHGIDKPGTTLRADLIDAHRTYLEDAPVVSSGPLMDDAGENMIGSLVIVDYATRAEVDAMLADEPFYKAGLFDRIDVSRWYQRVGPLQSATGG